MRNTWYPRGQAEYLSTVSDINPRTVVAERDFTFGLSSSKESQLLELNTSDTKATKHNARLVKQLTSLTVFHVLLCINFPLSLLTDLNI